jgi:hypothetical protein
MKRSDDELETQLQHWYQQGLQNQQMPDDLKKRLAAQVKQRTQTASAWQKLTQALWQLWSWRNLQALTAVLALGVGWQLLQQQPTYYQISQSTDVYPVQIHQLTEQRLASSPADTANAASGQRQAIYTQKYQDYLKARSNTQAQRQLIVSRQFSEDGWSLDVCQQMQLKLTSAWLAEFKQQLSWSEPQWQRLQKSDWLQVTTGPQGQILALQRSEQPPTCAP